MSDELMTLATERAKTDALVRELLAENERLRGLAEENEGAFKVWRRRCETAEARLRELASAEPVRWLCPDDETTASCECKWYSVPLIRRPEMPS